MNKANPVGTISVVLKGFSSSTIPHSGSFPPENVVSELERGAHGGGAGSGCGCRSATAGGGCVCRSATAGGGYVCRTVVAGGGCRSGQQALAVASHGGGGAATRLADRAGGLRWVFCEKKKVAVRV
ncbi:UNVERIFIED_CONTAM: hypothetical protein Sradi_5683900 [Sesamum radiatum]|uniref:Uncharacterized protein n=1 Tax=Sesamum radiatum TaxID=300843 RepID=A0AAW2L3Q2_SESRA